MFNKKEEVNEILRGMDEAMAEHEEKIKPPMCHFTPMLYDACDFEDWWECKHCGHTKLISSYPAY